MQEQPTIQDLLAELQEDPEDWSLRARICDLMLLEGRVGEADSLIETAPTPPDQELYILKAAEVFTASQPQKAVPLLYGYLQINPTSALAHLAMAEAAAKLGQFSSAQQYYERAVELNPGYRDPDFEQKYGMEFRNAVPKQTAFSPIQLSNLPTASSPSVSLESESSASNREPVPSTRTKNRAPSGVPGWVFPAIVALGTFLLCWMLLGLTLRASLLQALSEH